MKKQFVSIFVVMLLLFIASSALAAPSYPEIIPLPNGFFPEGIVAGDGPELFVGSLATGQIYRADPRTGEGEIVVDSPAGLPAVGLGYDRRTGLLFVAGGDSGMAFVYNPDTGETVATYTLTAPGSLVNDVAMTKEAVYFTDSFGPFFYRLPLGPGGSLPDPGAVEEIPLSGDFVFEPGNINANGIRATPNGKWLIIAHTMRFELYRVHPATGVATLIDLGGASLEFPDGIHLEGLTLYVTLSDLNQLAVVEMAPNLASGEVVEFIAHPGFDSPTTIADIGPYLYVANARFYTPPTPDTEYQVVRVEK